MSHLRRLFTFAVAAGITGLTLGAQAPLSPFDLALTIDEGTEEAAYRGWPLLLRGEAVLTDEVSIPFALDLPSLDVTIAPARGPVLHWPLKRVTEFASAPMLGAANEGVRVVWLLTAEQTAELLPGAYSARLSWAGRTSPAVTFTVSDAPAALSVDDQIRRALLQSQTAQYLGDTAGAIAALASVQVLQPDSIDLLVQRARVHVQRGEYRMALQATQHALRVFYREYPNAEEAPVSILEVESKARAELFKGITPGLRLPGLPGRGSLPASLPANPGPTVSASTSAAPGVGASLVAAVSTSGQDRPNPGGASAAGRIVPTSDLLEARILADPAGQWAATAAAGTQYGKTQYSPAQATGAPNISTAGNSPDAWCPENKNVGTDWLELTFAKPVHATEVRVRQNDAVGAITKIEAIEPDGTAHVWWEGVDPYVAPAVREIAWFAVRVPRTPYLVAKVKITLNLASGPGYKEIDAVQLVGAAQ